MSRDDDFRYVISNFDIRKLPKIFQRDVEIPVRTGNIVAITGPRRAGKTFIMFLIMEKLKDTLPEKNMFYINFESERLRHIDAGDLETALKVFYELNAPDPSKPIYIFLDEIQNVADWDRWVRSAFDRRLFNIYITGSSSELRSSKVATALRGRSLDYTVLPLSFSEFLRFNGVQAGNLDRLSYSEERGMMLNKLNEYLDFGSYPEVCLENNADIKSKILASYYQAIVYRDIGEKSGAGQALVNEAVLYLISNYAKYVSVSKIYNYLKGLGFKVSKQTIMEIIRVSQESYFAFFVEIFSRSIKNRKQYPRKVYIVDTGLLKPAQVVPGTGRSMENAVLLELVRRLNPFTNEICYWREYGNAEGAEVDFVIRQGVSVAQLIQVTYASARGEIRKEETQALVMAGSELGCDNLLVITWDYEGKENISGREIAFEPLWKWLLRK